MNDLFHIELAGTKSSSFRFQATVCGGRDPVSAIDAAARGMMARPSGAPPPRWQHRAAGDNKTFTQNARMGTDGRAAAALNIAVGGASCQTEFVSQHELTVPTSERVCRAVRGHPLAAKGWRGVGADRRTWRSHTRCVIRFVRSRTTTMHRSGFRSTCSKHHAEAAVQRSSF